MSDLAAQDFRSHLVSNFRPDFAPYEDLYRKLHEDPELSKHERSTASTVANSLRSLQDVHVKTEIGGHGLVGILQNGQGPTVMLRAELDALPILEQTGLRYAAAKRDNKAGPPQPAMHACGHDMHMAGLLASAELLHRAR